MIDDKIDLNVILLLVIIFLLISKDTIERFSSQTSCWIERNGKCKLNVDPNTATMCHNLEQSGAPKNCVVLGCPSGMDEGGTGRTFTDSRGNKIYDGNKGFCRPSVKNLMIQKKDELESTRGKKIIQLCTGAKNANGEPLYNNLNSIRKCARKTYRQITGAPQYSYCDGSVNNKCTYNSCYGNTTGKSLENVGIAKEAAVNNILQNLKSQKNENIIGGCSATDTIPTAIRELNKGTVGACIEGDVGMCSTVDEMVKNTDEKIEMLNKKIADDKTPDSLKLKLLEQQKGATQTKTLVNWLKENEYSKLTKTGSIDLKELGINKIINGTDARSRCFSLNKEVKELDKKFNGDPRNDGQYALQKCINEKGDLLAFNEITKSRQQEFDKVGQNITNTSAFVGTGVTKVSNQLTATQKRLKDFENMAKCIQNNGNYDSVTQVCKEKTTGKVINL